MISRKIVIYFKGGDNINLGSDSILNMFRDDIDREKKADPLE